VVIRAIKTYENYVADGTLSLYNEKQFKKQQFWTSDLSRTYAGESEVQNNFAAVNAIEDSHTLPRLTFSLWPQPKIPKNHHTNDLDQTLIEANKI
jgi:hypothetical protein